MLWDWDMRGEQEVSSREFAEWTVWWYEGLIWYLEVRRSHGHVFFSTDIEGVELSVGR